MATGPLNLAMLITADARGVAPATAETRRELESVGTAAGATGQKTRALAAANDEAAQAARRATEAARGQSAAERELRSAIDRRLGIGRNVGQIGDPFSGNPARRADIEAYGRSLDQLRAKYNPLYAEIQRYRTALVEIRQAHAVGAISTDEMTQAINRERQAALASISALKGRGQALRESAFMSGAGFQTANLAAQVQDIGVTSAMGMNPMQIALQQGLQMQMILGSQGAGGAARMLGSALTSLLTPVSLLTVGITGLAAAAIQWGMTAGEEVETVDDAFARHAETLERINERYEGFSERLQLYRENAAILGAAARDSLAVIEAASRRANQEFLETIGLQRQVQQGSTGEVVVFGTEFDVEERFRPFAQAVQDLRQEILAGEPDFIRFQERIEAIVATDPENLRALGDEILLAGQQAFRAAGGLDEARQAVDELGDAAAGRVEDVEGLSRALEKLSGIALPSLSNAEQAEKAFAEQIARTQSLGGLQLLDAEFIAALERSAQREAEEEERRRQRSGGREKVSDFEREIEAIRARTQALENEAAVVGLSTFAAEKYLATKELEAALARDGVALTEEHIALIEEEATAYARRVASTEEAIEAERALREEMRFRRHVIEGVVADMRSALDDGKVTFEELADVALNALDRIIDKMLNDLLDAIFEVNNAGQGGGGFLSFLGGLFGLGGGFTDFELAFSELPGPWAKGGAFDKAGVVPFARGAAFTNSVVTEPTLFRHGGGLGVMGEDTEEAILPLQRGPGGRLGVEATIRGGGGGAGSQQPSVVLVKLSPELVGSILAEAEGNAVRISSEQLENYDDALPDKVQGKIEAVQANPRRKSGTWG